MERQDLQVKTIAKFARKASALAKELAKAFDELANSLDFPVKENLYERKAIVPEETVDDYAQLRGKCEGVDSETLGKIVEGFVQSHSKEYMKTFIQSNNLPLSTKDSKVDIAKGLRQLLAQSAAISARVTPVGSSIGSSR